MKKKILITGATGSIASLVIPQLLKEGQYVRALVRQKSKGEALEKMGVELAEGEFSDQDALDRAADGVDAILAITPPNPDAVQQGRNILNAARKSGSPFYLRISALKAAEDAPQNNGRLHFQSDVDLIDSGLPHTILRPHYFMQNLLMSGDTIKSENQLYWGMGEGKLGMIDVRDIADCAAQILIRSESHLGKIYTLTGPDVIGVDDITRTLSEKIGRRINSIRIGLDDVYNSIIDSGWGEWGAEVMKGYSKAYSEGWGDFTTQDVKNILKKDARGIDVFVEEILTKAIE